MKKFALPRKNRLYNAPEFKRVYKKGKRVVGRYFIWFFLEEPVPASLTRLGVTVTKDVGNAVCRNRIKRQIREVFRLNKDRFLPGQLVIKARLAAGRAKNSLLKRDLLEGIGRIK